MLVWVYTFQNATLLEITCQGLYNTSEPWSARQQNILDIFALESWHSHHGSRLQALKVSAPWWDWRSKSRTPFKRAAKLWLRFLQWCIFSVATYQKAFIFGTYLPWQLTFTSSFQTPRFLPLGGGSGSKSRTPFKSATKFWLKFLKWCISQ